MPLEYDQVPRMPKAAELIGLARGRRKNAKPEAEARWRLNSDSVPRKMPACASSTPCQRTNSKEGDDAEDAQGEFVAASSEGVAVAALMSRQTKAAASDGEAEAVTSEPAICQDGLR